MTAAVVTGLGVIAPNGVGVKDFWEATLRGGTGIRPLERFDPSRYPARLAGQVADSAFDAAEHLPSRLLPQTDRMTRMALAATDWALADAQVDPAELDDYGMGVITASSSGGYEFGQRELQNLWAKGPEHVSAYQSFAWFYAVNTGQISIRNGMRGPSGVVVGEQAGGLDALGQARRMIRRGTPLMVSGGIDSALCPWGWIAHLSTGLVSTGDDPADAYLPFSDRAAGYVPGEGGAILVLEDAEQADRRGALANYGTLAGYAATFDAAPGSGRPPALRRAAELALADAGVDPKDVDVVFADAAAAPEADAQEAEAISGIFGERGVPVCAPKAMTGRLSSGGAPLDVVAALLSMRDGVLPSAGPVPGAADGLGLDLVTGGPRPAEARTALVLARGYGGFNSAVVLCGRRR